MRKKVSTKNRIKLIGNLYLLFQKGINTTVTFLHSKILVQITSIWLPAPYDSILPGFEAIFKAFENVGYIGELRQRWYEIKKLLKGGLPDAIPAAMHAK